MCGNTENAGPNGHVEMCERGLNTYREVLRGRPAPDDPPACVLEWGLLSRSPETGALVPVPPEVAVFGLTQPVERAILEHQHRLAAIRVSISHLEGVYREARQEDSLVHRLIGADVISTALEQAVSACTGELLTMQPGGGRAPALLAEALPRDLQLAARGVHQRTLYQHSVRTHGPTLAYVEQVGAAGAEVRTSDELFERLIVCDRAIAFIPSVRDRSTEALAIRHPGIVRYLVRSFELEWERSRPMTMLQEAGAEVLSDKIHHAVLRLLVHGVPDKAIASRLGISLRSVANHVKRACDATGSRSRTELGYQLAVRGLVDPAPDPADG